MIIEVPIYRIKRGLTLFQNVTETWPHHLFEMVTWLNDPKSYFCNKFCHISKIAQSGHTALKRALTCSVTHPHFFLYICNISIMNLHSPPMGQFCPEQQI